jgi:putative phosphonate metabolism protein
MKRFAIYYAPEAGPFAQAAAAWLGWDTVTGRSVTQPDVPDLAILTADPRKYGFHGTLKPPFCLAPGASLADLCDATATLAGHLPAVELPGLDLVNLHGFLALVPQGDTAALTKLAARVVADLDPIRAPLTPADIARRNPDRLTPHQRDLLARYGYPYVMDQFQFHLTLSGPLTPAQISALQPLAAAHFDPVLPRPFKLTDLCLFGEAADGAFHLLHRYPLTL